VTGGTERGGALPVVLVLLLVLLLVGFQLLLAAVGSRLTTARLRAAEEGYLAAESGLQVAAAVEAHRLAAALASGSELPLATREFLANGAAVRVTARDDDDGDGRPDADSNGRLLLVADGVSPALTRLPPSRRRVVREALVGAFLPLPGGLVDCTGATLLCGGTDGCSVPPVRIDGGEVAAVAAPLPVQADLRRRMLVLAREVLRRAQGQCAAATPACTPETEALRVAAATAVIRRAVDPAGDAGRLDSIEIGRLVANLLALEGSEAGPTQILWWDGSHRQIAEAEGLVAALESLGRPDGHLPDLADHPFPRVLDGASDLGPDDGVCRRLPPLMAAAVRRARELPAAAIGPSPGPPPADGTFVLSRPLTVPPGSTLRGRGLLLVREHLQVPAAAGIQWDGALVLAGGRVSGEGRVRVAGAVFDTGGRDPDAVPGLDLGQTAWSVTAAPDRHRRAWSASGVVLLSQWEEMAGE
jgi:hypothetical protein